MGLYMDVHNHQGRFISKLAHYFPLYERHLAKYVNSSVIMYEIGVDKGGSLEMWKKYLGPHAVIVGLDIDPECKQYEDDINGQCRVRIGDQGDTVFLQSVVDEFGPPDVVLDDGSHMVEDQIASFDFLYPLLRNNGTYIVEDLHTNYWEDFHGTTEIGTGKTFIDKAKSFVDIINGYEIYRRDKSTPLFSDLTMATSSVCFYESMAVFEKIRRGRINVLQAGSAF